MTAAPKLGRPFRAAGETIRHTQRYTVDEIDALCAAAARVGLDVGPAIRAAALAWAQSTQPTARTNKSTSQRRKKTQNP